MDEPNIAHVRKADCKRQTVAEHLRETATLARIHASKLGIPDSGELIGLIHDLGKCSSAFQAYIKSATGVLNPDEDEEFVDAKGLKGKIDHSTAGAQHVWRELSKQGPLGHIVGQIISLCIASHHSGLIDCLTTRLSEGVEDNFSQRMNKGDERSHLSEVLNKPDDEICKRVQAVLNDHTLIGDVEKLLHSIVKGSPDKNEKSLVAQFKIGLLVRFLFSCLLDADRQSSADFEKPMVAKHRLRGDYTSWEELATRLETHLRALKPHHPIDDLRRHISHHCLKAAERERGVFTLTVPTGGGKTLSSLRFALHHAHEHGLERVVYVIPYTTIIDQNAEKVRDILEPEDRPKERGRVVLEHHSNLGPEVQGWREKLLTEDWDAPVVYTTSVQFLEALFGAGTRGARRMHQLAKAVIVFDEIQTLPIRCVHLFNNAVNFLVDHCGSTVVLCTATQPLLGMVDKQKGAVRLAEGSEIMPDVQGLFESLKRVDVKDKRKPGGWSEEEIADLALQETAGAGSCLVVVNTKKAAKGLFRHLEGRKGIALHHLSTSMCPAHRKKVLAEVRYRLQTQQPVLCLSTQLIEAGVDVDFGAVIRYMAGLDSIAQAAGRCNRNGSRDIGIVHVINPADENLQRLEDIRIGRDVALRVIDEYRQDRDLIGPRAMECYYKYYFFNRKDEMGYNVSADKIGRDDTLLNLMSQNSLCVSEYARRHRAMPGPYLRQSFMTAAKAFQAIDAPTQGVIVPFEEEGKGIIASLCAAFDVEKQFELLRRAQQYTVNVFPHEFRKLQEEGALHETQEGTRIHYLNQRHYGKDFGVSTEPVAEEEFLNA